MSWVADRRFALQRAAAMVCDRPGAFVITTLLTAAALALPLFVGVLGYWVLPWGAPMLQATGPEANVFVVPGTSAAGVDALQAQLGRVGGVNRVRLIPRDRALADLAKRSGLAIPADRANPLPDVLVVQFSAGIDTASLDRSLESIKALPGVDRVRADIDWYRRARVLAIALGAVVVVLTSFVTALLFFVMVAAAREQANIRREEIAVMRLCGATSAFMGRPYVFLAAAGTGIGAAIATAVAVGAFAWVRPLIAELAQVMAQPLDARLPPPWMFGCVLLGAVGAGAVAGWIGTYRAIRQT